eukprot:647144-Amphidinium_carterae.2
METFPTYTPSKTRDAHTHTHVMYHTPLSSTPVPRQGSKYSKHGGTTHAHTKFLTNTAHTREVAFSIDVLVQPLKA